MSVERAAAMLKSRNEDEPTSVPAPGWTPHNSEYHLRDGRWSSSGIRMMLESPRLAWEIYVEDTRTERPSPAMRLGRIVNDLALGVDMYEMVPVRDRRTKAFKAAYANNPDCVTQAEHETAVAMIASLAKADTPMKRSAIDLLFNAPGYAEYATKFDLDVDLGEGETASIGCKSMLDRVISMEGGRPAYVEMKTTASPDPESFTKSAWNYGYDIQACVGLSALASVGAEDAVCFFVLLGTEHPFPVNVLVCSDLLLELGQMRLESALKAIAHRRAEDARRKAAGDPAIPWACDWEVLPEIDELEPPYWAERRMPL